MHEIVDQNGSIYYLTDYAIIALQRAKNAKDAETAFARHAHDVPARSRLAVWQGVDEIEIPA